MKSIHQRLLIFSPKPHATKDIWRRYFYLPHVQINSWGGHGRVGLTIKKHHFLFTLSSTSLKSHNPITKRKEWSTVTNQESQSERVRAKCLLKSSSSSVSFSSQHHKPLLFLLSILNHWGHWWRPSSGESSTTSRYAPCARAAAGPSGCVLRRRAAMPSTATYPISHSGSAHSLPRPAIALVAISERLLLLLLFSLFFYNV